jgi:predicted RNase H-like HicB family nuclease
MRTYIAAIHKDPNESEFAILFPGVPGCASQAATLDEVPSVALEALQGHLEVTRDFGDELPAPLTVSEAMMHEDGNGAVCYIAVPVDVDEGKAVRVNVTFTEGLLHSMDDFAKHRGVTRSAFLAKAVRQAMIRETKAG